MISFNIGDRVRDLRWGGQYTGVVKQVDSDGWVYVAWDGTFVEDQVSPDQIRKEEAR